MFKVVEKYDHEFDVACVAAQEKNHFHYECRKECPKNNLHIALKHSPESVEGDLNVKLLLQIVDGIFVCEIQLLHSIRHDEIFQEHTPIDRECKCQYEIQNQYRRLLCVLIDQTMSDDQSKGEEHVKSSRNMTKPLR